MFYKIFSKRVISSIIFLAFFINLFSGYGAFGKGLAFGYSLPISVGKVIERFDVSSGEKVFLIEDLHCHPVAEKNIENILSWIKANYGKDFNFIGLEGTRKEEIKFDRFRGLKKEVLDEIGEGLTKLGYTSGADLYAMKNDIKVYGIEENELYLNSLRKLYMSIIYRDRLEILHENLEGAYSRNQKYFQNEKVLEIIKKKEENIKGKLDFIKYIKFLKSEISEEDFREYKELNRVLDLECRKKELDLIGVESETRNLVLKLKGYIDEEDIKFLEGEDGENYYINLSVILERKRINISKNYRKVNDYIEYIKNKKEIDDMQCIEELERLERKVIDKNIMGLGDGKEFLDEMERMRLFFKYIRNEASIMDVEEYERGLKSFGEVGNKVFYKDYFEDFREDIDKSSENMKKFYVEANKRNEVMTNNLLNNRDRSKVSALLVGGFHATGIKNFLRARGIGYEVILPSIEGYDGKIYYEDRVKEEALRLGLVEEDGAILGKSVKRREENKLQLIDVFSSNGILCKEIYDLEGKDLEKKLVDIINTKNFRKDELKEALDRYNEAKNILRKETEKEGKKEAFEKLEEELDSNIDRILGKNKKRLFKRVKENLIKIFIFEEDYENAFLKRIEDSFKKIFNINSEKDDSESNEESYDDVKKIEYLFRKNFNINNEKDDLKSKNLKTKKAEKKDILSKAKEKDKIFTNVEKDLFFKFKEDDLENKKIIKSETNFYNFLNSKGIECSKDIYDLYQALKEEFNLKKPNTAIEKVEDFLSKNLLFKDDVSVKNILINCCYNSLNNKEDLKKYLNGVDIFFKFLVYFLNKDINIYYDKDNNFCLDMNLEDVEISQYLYIIFKDIDKKDEDFFKKKQKHLLFKKIKINLNNKNKEKNLPSDLIDFKTILTSYKYGYNKPNIIPDIEIKINNSLISEEELGLYSNNFWENFNSNEKDTEEKNLFLY